MCIRDSFKASNVDSREDMSKKEHGQIFYSKLHFDLSKKTTEDVYKRQIMCH